MKNQSEHTVFRQFEILRNIAISSVDGEKPGRTAEEALREAATLVGLEAASLLMWDDEGHPVLTVSFASDQAQKNALVDLQDDVFESLRRNNRMVSAYLTFGGESPLSGFTLPIRKGNRIFGAVAGLQPGRGSLAKEDLFLEALSATLSMTFAAAGLLDAKQDQEREIREERLKAIRETAATVNHEINNPLTAVLGNVQLLLMRSDELGGDFIRKLKIVEESALRIKDVTQKLMNLNSDRITEYTPGSQMIDLSDTEDQE